MPEMTGTTHSRPVSSLDDHLREIMALVEPLPAVKVSTTSPAAASASPLLHLAEDVIAAANIPPFSNSGVDGFVVHEADVQGEGPWTFPVSGDVAAGHAPHTASRGTAVRIMTGAPTGEETTGLRVVPIEDTTNPHYPTSHQAPTEVTIVRVDPQRRNIRLRGEHLQVGDVAVPAGSVLDAGTLATVLSVGVHQVAVHRLPRVAVVTTGDEVSRQASAWTVPNSNGPMLVRMLHTMGMEEVEHHHLSDDIAAFGAALDEISQQVDLIVTTGGISAGAYDVVRLASQRDNTMRFGQVAMSPGKPQGAGLWKGTPTICLPGNPVASWVSVPLFVAPAIRRLVGAPAATSVAKLPHYRLQLSEGIHPRPVRSQAIPVRISPAEGKAFAPAQRRSHMIAATVGCNGLALVPPAEQITAVEPLVVPVIPLP